MTIRSAFIFCGVLFCFLQEYVWTRETRITNGEDAELGQFPHQVLLNVRRSGNSSSTICGGSLIKPQYVLTAAHCIANALDIRLTLGEVNKTLRDFRERSPYRIDIGAKQWVTHEDYDISIFANDIGLIQLQAPLNLPEKYRDFIAPIKLNRRKTDSLIGRDLTVSGFGQTENFTLPNILQWTTVTMLSDAECLERKNANYLHESNMCAMTASSEHIQKSCKGDSGGPVTFHNALVGVISWGFPCNSSLPSGYARVEMFTKWIENKTRFADDENYW